MRNTWDSTLLCLQNSPAHWVFKPIGPQNHNEVHVNAHRQLTCYSVVHHMQELPNAYLKRHFCLLYLCGTHNSKQFQLISWLWTIGWASWSWRSMSCEFLSLGINLLVLEFLWISSSWREFPVVEVLCLWISFHLEWILVLESCGLIDAYIWPAYLMYVYIQESSQTYCACEVRHWQQYELMVYCASKMHNRLFYM